MHAEMQIALKSKELQDRFVPTGIEPAPGTLASYVAFIAGERERLGKIARKSGMRSDH